MKCPCCGDPNSYTGLQWIYCVNSKCHYYDAKYKAKIDREAAEEIEIDLDTFDLYDKVEKLIMLRGELADDDT